MSEFVLHIDNTALEKSLLNIAKDEAKGMQQIIIAALENFVRQKKPQHITILDPFHHSSEIDYHVTEDISGVKPFSQVKDSAAFGKALRLKTWGRIPNE